VLVCNWSIEDWRTLELLISVCCQTVYLLVNACLIGISLIPFAMGFISYHLSDNVVLLKTAETMIYSSSWFIFPNLMLMLLTYQAIRLRCIEFNITGEPNYQYLMKQSVLPDKGKGWSLMGKYYKKAQAVE
jgi:hypothetical protein